MAAHIQGMSKFGSLFIVAAMLLPSFAYAKVAATNLVIDPNNQEAGTYVIDADLADDGMSPANTYGQIRLNVQGGIQYYCLGNVALPGHFSGTFDTSKYGDPTLIKGVSVEGDSMNAVRGPGNAENCENQGDDGTSAAILGTQTFGVDGTVIFTIGSTPNIACIEGYTGTCDSGPTGSTTIDDMINDVHGNMSSTFGFNMDGIAIWFGDNVIKVFIGSFLGYIYGLRWWIIAVLVITSLIYFSLKGFRFFIH